MIIVHGSARVRAEHLNQALELSMAHVLRSRAEPGCLAHAVHRDHEDPLRLAFVERWSDLAALKAHFKVPESRDFAKALGALLTEPATLAMYEAAEVRP
jgi:quinol monooxygenase YgiN